MIITIKHKHSTFVYRAFSAFITVAFIFSSILPLQIVQAQTVLNLPAPGAMIPLSPADNPAMIKGILINPQNPLQFDFIIDTGDAHLEENKFNEEAAKLIKYFLASLTLKEEEMWVNLSPYEKNRIIPENFGQTEMGRDLLVQDYLLKQLTASLIYPEEELGKKFWDRVYEKIREQYDPDPGRALVSVGVNTFNKVWIVPESANVYEHEKGAFVVDSHLRVMLDRDYLAMDHNSVGARPGFARRLRRGEHAVPVQDNTLELSEQIIREILLPEIEREVNEGKTFANLRQIFNSMILATWYKQKLAGNGRDRSLLGEIYVNQNKIKGVGLDDPAVNQKIYEQYIEAFKKGVYNYIKEDYDPATQQIIPRKYFSGGVAVEKLKQVVETRSVASLSSIKASIKGTPRIVSARLDPEGDDAAQLKKITSASSPVGPEGQLEFGDRTRLTISTDHLQIKNFKGTEKKALQLLTGYPPEIQKKAARLLAIGKWRSMDKNFIAFKDIYSRVLTGQLKVVDLDRRPIEDSLNVFDEIQWNDAVLLQSDGNLAMEELAFLPKRLLKKFDASDNDTAPSPVGPGWLNGAISNDARILQRAIFTEGIDAWLNNYEQRRGSAEEIEAAIRKMIDDDDFMKKLEESEAWAGITIIRYAVMNNIYLGTKSFATFTSRLKQRASKLIQKKISKVDLPVIAYVNFMTSLGHRSVQEYLESKVFQKIDKEDKLAALVDEIHKIGLPLNNSHLSSIFTGLPLRLSPSITKEDFTFSSASSPVEATKGGIDFNPNHFDLQTQGGGFDFQLPHNSKGLQGIRIDGFTPVIINVAPLTNLPLLLGLANEKNTEGAENVRVTPGRDPINRKMEYDEETYMSKLVLRCRR